MWPASDSVLQALATADWRDSRLRAQVLNVVLAGQIAERAGERQQHRDPPGSVDLARVEALQAGAVAALDHRAKPERGAARVDRADHPDAQELRIPEEARHRSG